MSQFEIARIGSATISISMGAAKKLKIHPTIAVIQDEAGGHRRAKNRLPIPPSSAAIPTIAEKCQQRKRIVSGIHEIKHDGYA